MTGERFDVAVVGGGAAGIAAALAAAGEGARTVLVERETGLGGNIAQALVHTLCGLYLPAEAGDAVPANPGFATRFAAELQRAGAAGEPERAGRVWVLPTDPPRLCAVADRLSREAPGLELLMGHETVRASLAEGGADPQRLALRDAGGRDLEIAAVTIVDASGDAVVAALGGAETDMAGPDELQIPSYIFRLSGVETGALRELQGFGRLRVTRAVANAVRSGELPEGCESVLVRPSFDAGTLYVTLNLSRLPAPYDPLDPDVAASLGARGRDAANRVVAYLRETREAFAQCRVDIWPARIGIRETRRMLSRSDVTGDDVRAGRRSDDEIAVSSWPIELWHDHRRVHLEHPAGPASIPLGTLVSRSHPRLAAAGRCLGCDHEAHGALRVLGTALASGEAAGVAAALAADAGTDLAAVVPESVRERIRARADAGPALARSTGASR